jgi:F0F1-type ATP synthase assembly protein I
MSPLEQNAWKDLLMMAMALIALLICSMLIGVFLGFLIWGL